MNRKYASQNRDDSNKGNRNGKDRYSDQNNEYRYQRPRRVNDEAGTMINPGLAQAAMELQKQLPAELRPRAPRYFDSLPRISAIGHEGINHVNMINNTQVAISRVFSFGYHLLFNFMGKEFLSVEAVRAYYGMGASEKKDSLRSYSGQSGQLINSLRKMPMFPELNALLADAYYTRFATVPTLTALIKDMRGTFDHYVEMPFHPASDEELQARRDEINAHNHSRIRYFEYKALYHHANTNSWVIRQRVPSSANAINIANETRTALRSGREINLWQFLSINGKKTIEEPSSDSAQAIAETNNRIREMYFDTDAYQTWFNAALEERRKQKAEEHRANQKFNKNAAKQNKPKQQGIVDNELPIPQEDTGLIVEQPIESVNTSVELPVAIEAVNETVEELVQLDDSASAEISQQELDTLKAERELAALKQEYAAQQEQQQETGASNGITAEDFQAPTSFGQALQEALVNDKRAA